MSSKYAEGVRAATPIGVAAAVFALSFGVLARAAGMGWAAPLVMSATTFAGSAQFAVASILNDSGAAAVAITAAVMLNARYAPIGISVASSFKGSPLRRRGDGCARPAGVLAHSERDDPALDEAAGEA